MNLIKELIKKHHGYYPEKERTEFSIPGGNFIYEPGKGIIDVNGSKISIRSNTIEAASPTRESFQIKVLFKNNLNTYLEISPKSKFQRMIDAIMMQKGREIQQEFIVKGDTNLIVNLISNRTLARLLHKEKVHLKIDRENPTVMTLSPENPIKNVDRFEKYLNILKIIENKAIQLQLTTAF
ncbi:hypothetical protein [Christiangramia sp. SM2212]|uniref:Uncharacterized protein n=1 Tax=Christiangramia sediminicola TaxID=3073267 RepID=A0ABU1ELL5_9FLAO|nr:hypothetical protein [Christiangramia sp. SM2212]MDR5589073.1 hypothetical protein [Christiangramia sp. SM2212]